MPMRLFSTFALLCLLAASTVHAFELICTSSYETPCSITTSQNFVHTIVKRLERATTYSEVNQIYYNVTHGSDYHLKGGFYAVVISREFRFLAHGGSASFVNQSWTTAYRNKGIINEPNILKMTYYAGVAEGAWQIYLTTPTPGSPARLRRGYNLAAKLFDGTLVDVSAGYFKVDPTIGYTPCDPTSFQVCATESVSALVDYTISWLSTAKTETDFQIMLTEMNNKSKFQMYHGFTAFVVNVTNGGTFLASGIDKSFVGLMWSQIAKKVGATTRNDLDSYINNFITTNDFATWIKFPWTGTPEGDFDMNILIKPVQWEGSLLYVGSYVHDPYPYYEYSNFSTNSTLMGLAATVIVLFSLLYLVEAGVFIYFKDSALIKMSSLRLVLMSLFGGLLLNATSILYFLFPSDGSNTICVARAWLMPIGLSLMVNPILAKTYRISVLVNTMKKVKHMNGTFVALFTLAFMIPPLLILAATSEVYPSYVTTDAYTVAGPYVNLSQCQDYSTVYGLLMAWYAGLVFYCFYLAFLVRNAPDGFNEASYLYTACSFLLVYGILILPIQFLLSSSPQAQSVLRGFGVLLGSFVFTGAIALPKIYHIYHGDHNSDVLMKARTYKTVGSNSKTGTTTEKIVPVAVDELPLEPTDDVDA